MSAPAVPLTYGFRVEPRGEAVSDARRRVVAVARTWGLPLEEEAFDDLALLCSEVITNAVTHTSGTCAVLVRWTGARLRVEVTDTDLALPKATPGGRHAEQGRGLILVDALAADWGTAEVTAGKVVWFEVGPTQSTTGTERLTALVRAVVPLLPSQRPHPKAFRQWPWSLADGPAAGVMCSS